MNKVYGTSVLYIKLLTILYIFKEDLKMDNMQNVFGAETEAPVTAEQNAAKKQKIAVIKEAMKATLSTDATYQERLHKWSGSVKVVNTLGYGKNGNIVVDKAAKTDSRTLKATSKIVGYKIQNIGSEAITYQTEVWALDKETGKYVPTSQSKTLAPGETACLTRQYMTMFCAQPEISFVLANGKIISSARKAGKSLKDELSAYYFSFDKSEDGTTVAVNDDEVKLSVDDANGAVKPEYVDTFGFLNNPKDKVSKAKPPKVTAQEMMANYVNRLIQDKGM